MPLAHQRGALGLLVAVLGIGLVEHAQDAVGQGVEELAHLARESSVPVGLFGLARKTARTRPPPGAGLAHASSTASRSKRRSRSGTWTTPAPCTAAAEM